MYRFSGSPEAPPRVHWYRHSISCLSTLRMLLMVGACSLAAVQTLTAQAAPADTLPQATRVAADPSRGFVSPYYLYVPPVLRADSARGRPHTILVMPNNTGTTDDDPAAHERYVREVIGYYRKVAGRLGVAVLMPAFPRPRSADGIYTHALDRDALLTREPGLRRLDLQLIGMVDDARRRLASEGIRIERRVLLHGHSAAGMFVNRFVLLHPGRVKAATIGAPGGWPIAPVASHAGRRLRYPAGVADLREVAGRPFDRRRAAAVPLFFFLGAEDTNDSVPYDDSYDPEDRAAVAEVLGTTPAARWPAAEALYRAVLPQATFRTYPGVGHEITRAMWDDIWAFLAPHAAR
jgi:hypothetical protein